MEKTQCLQQGQQHLSSQLSCVFNLGNNLFIYLFGANQKEHRKGNNLFKEKLRQSLSLIHPKRRADLGTLMFLLMLKLKKRLNVIKLLTKSRARKMLTKTSG